MARAILVIDVQKIYTDPASPLHCAENAEAIAVEKSENAIQRRSNITSATNGGGIRHASLPMQAVELRPASRARDTLDVLRWRVKCTVTAILRSTVARCEW